MTSEELSDILARLYYRAADFGRDVTLTDDEFQALGELSLNLARKIHAEAQDARRQQAIAKAPQPIAPRKRVLDL